MKTRFALLPVLLLLPLVAACGLVEKGTHNAGKNCMWPGCHGSEAPSWTYAGTVFSSVDRSSPARGVMVTITGATGEIELKANSAGNFYSLDGNPTDGYRASVSDRERTLTMRPAQTSGACNSCHAPGSQTQPLSIE